MINYNPFFNDNISEDRIKKSIDILFKEFYDPPTEIDSEGTKIWKNLKGELHRDNGPAVIYKGGNKYWYQNGKRHRDNDLPAVIYKNGDKYWYQNGLRHRVDGPAVVWPNGREWYYIFDICLELKELFEEKVLEIKKRGDL